MVTVHENPEVKKRKRVSKKLKSSWRKHVDISDVDNFLEERRLEERLGDYSKLENKQLFFVDTKQKADKLTTKQAKRLKIRAAPLKSCALLQPLTQVPDPIAKRNRVRTKEERKSDILKKIEQQKREDGIFKKKDLRRARDMQRAKERRAKKESRYEFNRNIWDEDDKKLAPRSKDVCEIEDTVADDQWIQGDVERHILHGPGKRAKFAPKYKQPSIVNAVELPHPGMSYNPSFEDHQALLQIIAEKEQKIIKEEKHLKRVTTAMFGKVTTAQRDQNWLVEMSEGLKPDQSTTAKEEDKEEYKAINPPVVNKEKSTKQRRKQKEQQELQEQLRQARISKKKVSDIHRLKFINKQLEAAEKKKKMLHEKRLKKAEYAKLEAKRLGRNKFEEPELEFNMGKDLSGNLRNMKIEGNLLRDRFKSLQKRNIIEPTVIKMHKKPKVKKYVRSGHREADIKSQVATKELS